VSASVDLFDLTLVTHRDVVDRLPASIREDFRRLDETDPGELWRLPAAPVPSGSNPTGVTATPCRGPVTLRTIRGVSMTHARRRVVVASR
jgi:hypothetical protein